MSLGDIICLFAATFCVVGQLIVLNNKMDAIIAELKRFNDRQK